MIDIRPLKQLCRQELPTGSLLRMSIEAERDYLLPEEYFAKLKVWLVMLDRELGKTKWKMLYDTQN